jgi:pimeloyl-ACP methyl ester carboxylesterase
VGHDHGGIVISQMAEQRPARVEKLVYLAAFLLPAGQAMLPVFMSDTRSAIIQNLMIDDDEWDCMVVKEEACREAMYQDCSEEDTALAVSLLAPEPVVPLTTPLDLSERNFGRVPRVYIETRCDNAVTLSMQRKMIADMPCEAVISMNTSHSPFFCAPQEHVGPPARKCRETQAFADFHPVGQPFLGFLRRGYGQRPCLPDESTLAESAAVLHPGHRPALLILPTPSTFLEMYYFLG